MIYPATNPVPRILWLSPPSNKNIVIVIERQVFYSINQENKAAWGNGNVPAGLASQRPTVPSQRPRGPIDGRVRPGREEFSSCACTRCRKCFCRLAPNTSFGMGPTRLELRCPGTCRWVYIEPDCSTTPALPQCFCHLAPDASFGMSPTRLHKLGAQVHAGGCPSSPTARPAPVTPFSSPSRRATWHPLDDHIASTTFPHVQGPLPCRRLRVLQVAEIPARWLLAALCGW